MPDTARLYSGRSADERDADRRRRLLAAGRELFATAGYAATSVERLCSEAKVSTRHFYQLYEGKEPAFLDVYGEINRDALDRALEALAETEGRPFPDRLTQVLYAYLGPLVDDLRATRIAIVVAVGLSPRVEEFRLAQREVLLGIAEQEGRAAVARGEIADRDFRFATLALVGAANAVLYDWSVRGGDGDVTALEERLAEIALQLLAR